MQTNLESGNESMTKESNDSNQPLIEPETKDREGSVPEANNENQNKDILLASLIEKKLEQASNPFSVDRCIYRIPDLLRKHNEKAFVPFLVSIGPFHRGKENLKTMEEVKRSYSRCLLDLDRKPPPEPNLEYLVTAIRTIEQACRNCYPENIGMTTDEFIKMMVIDGCFILEFCNRFARYAGVVSADSEDRLFSTSWMRWAVLNDLVLLENQIPWIALECLFSRTSKLEKPDLSELIQNTFNAYTRGLPPKPSDENLKYRHVLDFIRNSLLGSYGRSQSNASSEESHMIPSVTELRLAGVKFRYRNGGDKMLKITFKNGVMKIPSISVLEENKESLLGNLIAYEQCQHGLGYQITSYVLLLDNLLKSRKDVEFLAEKKILEKVWSSKEVAGFFSRVYINTRLYKYSYPEVQEEVNAYLASPWHKWKMILRRDYLKNPCSSS